MSGIGAALWNELASNDLEKSKAFYGEILGWTYDEMPMDDGPYHIAKAGDHQAAGLMQSPMPEMPSIWVPYFHVADAAATAEKVKAAGGTVIMPVVDVPNVGKLFWCKDPAGAVVAFMAPSENG